MGRPPVPRMAPFMGSARQFLTLRLLCEAQPTGTTLVTRLLLTYGVRLVSPATALVLMLQRQQAFTAWLLFVQMTHPLLVPPELVTLTVQLCRRPLTWLNTLFAVPLKKRCVAFPRLAQEMLSSPPRVLSH